MSTTHDLVATNADANELFFDVQQKTDKQHILDNPDTYIGSVENVDMNAWVMDKDNTGEKNIVHRDIHLIPALYKLFDEGIVNCRDHVVRMKTAVDNHVENALPVTHIDVDIASDGTITLTNDGNGIDVAQKDGLWIPELVFGHLRTSTNYNKEEKRIVGGKNGFGFKLVLIWSTYGRVETVDHIRGLKYIQEFRSNLDEISPPTVTKCKTKPYTRVTFRPDYTRFGVDGLNDDMLALLTKRIYDISAVTDKNIKVKHNGQLIPVKNFEQYINLYIGEKTTTPRVYEAVGDRWEYAVALTPNAEFVQVSFVNGIHTAKGGKHVDYILGQIIRKLSDYIEKKKKIKVNPNSIKEQLMLFLRCDIENPAFDSQTKDYMNTPSNKFGSRCEVSDKFIEKVAKMGVMDAALQLTELKDNRAVKKTDGTKTVSVRGIPKLVDANYAGTNKSGDCVLILCEGDSAKAGILSGLSAEDRNTVGVYPLKGKLMNVRGETPKKIADNKEITEIKQILGLGAKKQYETREDIDRHLRYGKVLFMTDQDLDGSHIKGLCMNLFACEWPSLLEIDGFIGFMNTPILKAKKGTQELQFYNEGEYTQWQSTNDTKGWHIKYYKGLGTSTGKEFKEYFQTKKLVNFTYSKDISGQTIDMVFNDKRADDRKQWLKTYDRHAYLNTSAPSVTYEDFIHRELIHFSKHDCDRSIPNLMDGLKTSQRKILYSAFKRNLTSEIKVAQFSGYVSEQAQYHHGEVSLNMAIVGMAQNFVGSNNINLLIPNGQFGTRLKGGKDCASARYIYTALNKMTHYLFPPQDFPVLNYLEDDGIPVEPIYYVPIIPMVLVNGSKGIGTGFSTDIMCYNPTTIIEYLQNKLRSVEDDTLRFVPYYEGFKGTIVEIGDGAGTGGGEKYLICGTYEKVGEDKIRITELPVGYWTDDFKERLEVLSNPSEDKDKNKIPAVIKHVHDQSTDSTVDFTVTFVKGKLDELESAKGDYGRNGLEKLLKLYKTNTASNMNLFDSEEKLQKYDKVSDIIDAYYEVRLALYQTRKEHMILQLERELRLLSNRAKYIGENLAGTIDLRRKKQDEVRELLVSKGYDMIDEDTAFKYLVRMPMDSVTEENVAKLNAEHGAKLSELEGVKNTSPKQMWLNELGELRVQYEAYRSGREQMAMSERSEHGGGTTKGHSSKAKTTKARPKKSVAK